MVGGDLVAAVVSLGAFRVCGLVWYGLVLCVACR